MRIWSRASLIREAGRHLYSGANARVQVLEVRNPKTEIWKIPKGDLLATVVSGPCWFSDGSCDQELNSGDQVFLEEGESFVFYLREVGHIAAVQCVWFPGITGPSKE
jgi:hypothetical protein